MTAPHHRRRVGAVRPSHLMYTSGVGSLVDLPNFSVLVRGLDDWSDKDSVFDPINLTFASLLILERDCGVDLRVRCRDRPN